MKKLFTPCLLTLLSLGLFSCGGSHECFCNTTTDFGGGNVEQGTLTKTFKGPRSLASSSCKNENMNYTANGYTYTATCSLR